MTAFLFPAVLQSRALAACVVMADVRVMALVVGLSASPLTRVWATVESLCVLSSPTWEWSQSNEQMLWCTKTQNYQCFLFFLPFSNTQHFLSDHTTGQFRVNVQPLFDGAGVDGLCDGAGQENY